MGGQAADRHTCATKWLLNAVGVFTAHAFFIGTAYGLFRAIGPAVFVFGVVPSIACAILFASSLAIIDSLVLLAIMNAVQNRFVPMQMPYDLVSHAVGAFVIGAVGFVVGRYRALGLRLESELDKRQSIEDELEAYHQRAEAASKLTSLGEVAAQIGHEINNPIVIIVGYAERALRSIKSGEVDLQELEEHLRNIKETAFRVAKIVRSLRGFVHETNTEDPETINVSRLIEQAIELCRPRLSQGIELTRSGEASLTAYLRPTQILQILVNLLSNACDAVETCATRAIDIELCDEGEDIALAVSDSGAGISPGIREKLFQPFFTSKPVGKGTGLGLTVSVRLAEANHGKLSYDSTSKKTRFVLRLPRDFRNVQPHSLEATKIAG